jgi:hypothetical protein
MPTDSSGDALRGIRHLPGRRAGAVVSGHVATVAGHTAFVVVDVDTLAAQGALTPGDDVGELRHSLLLLLPADAVQKGGGLPIDVSEL